MTSCSISTTKGFCKNTISSRFGVRRNLAEAPRRWQALLGTCTAALLSGCIMVPVPYSHHAGPEAGSRANVGDAAPPTVVRGETTRVQVLMKLGEPDGRGDGDSWFNYESIENRGGVQWLAAGAVVNTVGAISLGNWDVSRRLTIRFSADGTVSDVSLQQTKCNQWGAIPCPDPRGSDLVAEDAKTKAFASAGSITKPYEGFWSFVESKHSVCEYPGSSAAVRGGAFGVGEQASVWEEAHVWRTLPLKDIEEVRPVEMHWPRVWIIPIKKRDGTCMFVTVLPKSGIVGKGLQEEARAAIAARIDALTSTSGASNR